MFPIHDSPTGPSSHFMDLDHPEDLDARIHRFFISIQRQYRINSEVLFNHGSFLFNRKVSLSGGELNAEFSYDRNAFKPIQKGENVIEVRRFESNILSKSERKRRLEAICAQYPGAGSTSFFNLLTDHLFSCFKKSRYPGPLKTVLERFYSLIGFFSDSIATIQSGEHFLEFVCDRGVRYTQKSFVQQLKIYQEDLKNLAIHCPNDPHVEEFISTCELLMDLFLEEMHTLGLPATSYPEDISSVFQIARIRIDRIIFFLEGCERAIREDINGGDQVLKALDETRKKWVPKLRHLKSKLQGVCDDPKA